MLLCQNPINLIRYLMILRVNSSLVYFPRYISIELSSILGCIIANRLPTNESYIWRKALDIKSKLGFYPHIVDKPWPIEAVLFVYPGKKTYGRGEFIFWELKLFGESADHGFFLESILPAMEEASYISDPEVNYPNSLWGSFDIHSVYVAHGGKWENLVNEGILNLRYQASPFHWSDGLDMEKEYKEPTRLAWVTPFNINKRPRIDSKKSGNKNKPQQNLLLGDIISSLLDRIKILGYDPDNLVDSLSVPEIMELADQVTVMHSKFENAHNSPSGCRIGSQILSYIPEPLIPYLQLASILHIGKYTHFGCGTFSLIRSTSDLVGSAIPK